MKFLSHLIRSVLLLAIAAGIWCTGTAAAWAAPVEDAAAEKSYSMPYLLILLVVALGLMLVLRPSMRAYLARIERQD